MMSILICYLFVSSFLHFTHDNSFFPLISPLPDLFILRIWSILKPSFQLSSRCHYHMPVRVRICLLIKVVLKLLLHPLTDVLWLLDEILFPSYRKQPIRSPVFIVGGFRTGSTSLHRTLNSVLIAAAEEHRSTIISPMFVELFFPFLTFQYFFDFLERRNSVVISTLQRFFFTNYPRQ